MQAYNARWGVHLDKPLCMEAYADPVAEFKVCLRASSRLHERRCELLL